MGEGTIDCAVIKVTRKIAANFRHIDFMFFAPLYPTAGSSNVAAHTAPR